LRLVKDSLALALQVVELAAPQRPGEDADDRQHQKRRERNQQEEDVHRLSSHARERRIALATTSTELSAMPRPAAHGGSQPTSASGTQVAL